MGKLVNVRNLHPLSSPPPIQKEASWGSSGQLPHHLYRRRARGEVSKRPQLTPPYLPHHLYRKRPRGEAQVNCLTTYTEDGLVGKSVNVRNLHPLSPPPPIQKEASWGTSGQLPHHLYRRRPRGEVGKRPQLTPPIFPTTYTEVGLVGKLGSTSLPPI